MNETIKKIADSWKLDARFEDSNKYFYNYNEVGLILDDKKCYVIGRKGSGKTAICEHILKTKEFNLFSEKLGFKNFPFNELYGLGNGKYTQPNQYITIWKYLIYSTVCRLMVSNENIDASVREMLEKLYPKNDLKQLARRITEWTSAEFGATVLGSGGSVKLSRQISDNKIPWIEKTDILEDIILEHCDDSKYYIVFDELDEDYRDVAGNDSVQYIALLTSLFKAVQDIKATFLGTNKHIMPIVFLRDDIYTLINDSDKNKWSDLKIELEWSKDRIKSLLAYRISKDYMDGLQQLSFNEAWETIFTRTPISYGSRQGKKTHSFDFIANSTHLRPRDFIRYIQCCCAETVTKGDAFITNGTIKYEDRAFSNYMKDEVKDEIFPLLPDIENIFQVLSNLRKWNFSVNEFIREYNKYVATGKIKEENTDYVLDVLFNFSVIGNQDKHHKDIYYFKYQHTNMTYNKNENVVIHRGLFKALQIL